MRKNGFKILILPIIFGMLFISCSQNDHANIIYDQEIIVDGEISDWKDIPAVKVNKKDHLWYGEGLLEGAWKGQDDLSYSWKKAWKNGKLYFLFEVKDDTISNFDQEFAWLNDCIEIYLDPENFGGERISGIGSEETLEDRIGKEMRGFEMQFLPSNPPKVFVDDSKGVYFTEEDQNTIFEKDWNGEVVSRKTEDGYLMEIAFTIPGVEIKSGQEMGMEIGICDDDGQGRKSLMLWSGYKGEFWLTMDNFMKISFE